jgi:small subunit ribosomal protein S20
MAHHASAIKRIKADEKKRLKNRYKRKTCTTLIKKLRSIKEKKEATAQLNVVFSHLDKLVKHNIFHKNKSANIKSNLYLHINAL